jgi:uncharacterized protein (DUF433 family)
VFELTDRITIEEGKCAGRPCIRGLRVRVQDVVEMMAGGPAAESILRAHPDLDVDDLRASLAYAARQMDDELIRRTILRRLSLGERLVELR